MLRIRSMHARIEILRESVDSESKKRVEKSRSVILGQVAEHFAPILPGFTYNHKDARFLGQPVDYLIFNGMNDADGGHIELVFCEIKSGESKLSSTERAIRDAIAAGRVRFEVLRLANDGSMHVD